VDVNPPLDFLITLHGQDTV